MRSSGTKPAKAKAKANSAIIFISAAIIIATASAAFYFSTGVHAASANAAQPAIHNPLSSKSFSFPLFFEPNQGQSDSQVKFLARGKGYGLFLTANEAVLKLQPARKNNHSFAASQPAPSSVLRMRLEGANPSSQVTGASPLPSKSNYFIGNDPAKWRQNIPQFAQVQYHSVYSGVDLIYYGNQGQLEYDFRVAPGADPNQIALNFNGASPRIQAGDLLLSTSNGDVRFHAPLIYQPAQPAKANTPAIAEKSIAGSFLQLAGNKIGFTIADYDHSRELVIDPTLSYSTFLGGTGTEGNVQVAVDSSLRVYVAGSTTSAYFFPLISCTISPSCNYEDTTLAGGEDIFIAVFDTTRQPPQYTTQLLYTTYLGGSGTETPAGLAVDSSFGIYVAGTTNSTDFPTTTNAFQTAPAVPGTPHGFLTKIALTTTTSPSFYSLTYSTYLAGNGSDIVAGLAIDPNCGGLACNAYVTGSTTSTNAIADSFPANSRGYQTSTNAPAADPTYPQFFASKINPNGSGTQSMLYSTYFGGSLPASGVIAGCSTTSFNPPCGGIAVDTAGNMYITGTTNMLPSQPGQNGFPLLDAQQQCLNSGSTTTSCPTPTTNTDAFAAKINPNFVGSGSLLYSSYLGGSGNDTGNAIAVDTTTNAYITGSTSSTDWIFNGSEFQTTGYGGGPSDAYLAKVGTQSGSSFPLSYFTYIGGSGTDVGNAIAVDSQNTAHIVGSTSGAFPTVNPIQPSATSSYSGTGPGLDGDAFVASISTTLGGTFATPDGDSLTYLGGSDLDQGTSIALDIFNATYVGGNTASPDFPVTATALQPTYAGSTDAFVSKLGTLSTITLTPHASSPSPSPAPLGGTPAAFTFDITNTGPDTASSISFSATVMPSSGLAALASPPTGKITQNLGTCSGAQGQSDIVTCFIPTLAAGAVASVEVDVTTNDTTTPVVTSIQVSASASANGSGPSANSTQTVPVVDFTIAASTPTPSITAGQSVSIPVNFCPSDPNQGYSGTITPTDTITPSMVTSGTPTFNPTTVTLSGSACASTTLTITTVARPVTTGSLLRHRSFYAAWFPIGGLSLAGLGLGAGYKRRRWLIGAVLGLILGIIALLPGCGSASTATNTQPGTLAGTYNITITGAASAGASHSAFVQLHVN